MGIFIFLYDCWPFHTNWNLPFKACFKIFFIVSISLLRLGHSKVVMFVLYSSTYKKQVCNERRELNRHISLLRKCANYKSFKIKESGIITVTLLESLHN